MTRIAESRLKSTATALCLWRLASWLLNFFFLSLAPLLPAQELWERLPRENRAVHDFADVIGDDKERALESQLRSAYAATATPVVVVTLNSLDGGEIDDFTNRLYERWGIGTRPDNRGVLFVVAVQERKMRLEVGYGSEPVLTDAYTASLIRDHAAPRFRSGDYSGGIQAVVDRLIAPLETGQTPPVRQSSDRDGVPDWIFLPFFLLLLLFFRGGRGRRRRGRYYRHHGPFIGGGFGGSGGFRGGGGFGGFGGGFSGGGGASGGW